MGINSAPISKVHSKCRGGVYPRPNNVLNLHLSLIGKQWKFKIFEGVIKKCLKLSCAGSSLQALFYY